MSADVVECLRTHASDLSDVCRTRLVNHLDIYGDGTLDDDTTDGANTHKHTQKEYIPTHFIESQYYFLTRIITAVALMLLLFPFAVSLYVARIAMTLRVRMHAFSHAPQETTDATPEAVLPHHSTTPPTGPTQRHPKAPQAQPTHASDSQPTTRRHRRTIPRPHTPTNVSCFNLSFYVNESYTRAATRTVAQCTRRLTRRHTQSRGHMHSVSHGDKSDGLCLLHGVNVRIRSGRLTAIMGPSGSGKSTLLGLLSGHTRAGVVSRNAQHTTHARVCARLRGCGCVHAV